VCLALLSRTPILVNWHYCLVYCRGRTHNQMESHPGSTHNLNNESAYSLSNRHCILRPGRSANHTQMDQTCAYLGFFTSTNYDSLTLEKKYEDWNEIDFQITFGAFGEHSMQVIKRKKVPTSFNKASQTEESAATDSTNISTNRLRRESMDHID
jgi:hypothetical protein